MAQYTLADERARKQAAGIPLNNGVMPPKTAPVKPMAAQTPKPSTGGVVPPMTPQAQSTGMAGVYGAMPTRTPTPAPAATGGVIPPMMPTAAQTNQSTAMAGAYAASPIPQAASGGVVPSRDPFATYGGKDKYVSDQQGRYDQAIATGDTALIGKLIADSQRAGYSLNTTRPQKEEPTPVVTPSGGVIPAQSNGTVGQLTPGQITTEAQAQLDRERAGLQTAATERLAKLRSGFEYGNKLLQDNRVLENAAFQRQNDPFSGQTDYAAAILGRGRQIDDSARNAQFNADVATISSDLYNFDKLAPERRQQIINEQTRIERQYGLEVGSLTGYFNNQRTLAGQGLDLQRDQFQYQQGQDQIQNDAQYGGTYNGQKTAAQQAQEWNQRFQYGNAIGQFGNGQQTLESRQFDEGVRQDNRNFDRAKYESDRNYQLQVQQQTIASGQWQQQFNMDVEKFGFQKASEIWSQAFQENQANQDNTYRQKTLDQQMTQAERTAMTQASDSILKSGLVTVSKDIKGNETMSVTNPDSLNKYIKALNLSDNATDALLYQYGLDSYVKK